MDINPYAPCHAPRGSDLRIAWYRARDEAGLPLWNPEDSRTTVPPPWFGPVKAPLFAVSLQHTPDNFTPETF